MNVLYLTKEFPPDTNWGGIGTYTHLMVKEIAKHVKSVIVLTSTPNESRIEKKDNITVYRVHKSGFSSKRVMYPFFIYFDLIKIIKEHKIDLIEVPEVNAELFFYQFLKKSFPKIIVRFHTPTFMLTKLSGNKPSFLSKLTSYMEKRMVLRADALTSPSKDLAKIVTKRWGITKEIKIIKNGIKLSNSKNPKSGNNGVVLFIGRLEKRKGVELLARTIPLVLKKCPDMKFIFIGKDVVFEGVNMSKKIVELAGNKDNLEFTGFVSNFKKKKLINDASCIVLPSIWENFPYTCLESLNDGKIVIATNVGGFKEIITNGKNGFLVKQNSKKLANIILSVAWDNELRKSIGKSTLNMRKKFSIELVARKTVDFYRLLIG